MKRLFVNIVFAIVLFFVTKLLAASGDELPAFPGAEGYGAFTPGGRGGKVYLITTLEDYLSGKERVIHGSLREAIEAEGSRIIIFRVAGNIRLKDPLIITNPFITIAGQTAPGDGICLQDYPLLISYTHDVIIRFIHSRLGDLERKKNDAISISHSGNVIIDHCSTSWSIDEVLSTQLSTGGVTVQWCILSEALNDSYHSKETDHGYASIISGPASYHHNLYAHNYSRNPRPNMKRVDFRNNVIYNYGKRPGYSGRQPVEINYVGNYIKPGPSTNPEVRGTAFQAGGPETKIYMNGNLLIDSGASTEYHTDWQLLKIGHIKDESEFRDEIPNAMKESVYRTQPFTAPFVTTWPAQIAYQKVLKNVGAYLPTRDELDRRIIQDVQDETGRVIDSQQEVGGWPVLRPGLIPKDSDSDGMPDEWEEKHGFNPGNARDNNMDADADGYTNLEEYLNFTDPHQPFIWVIPPDIIPDDGDIFLDSVEVKLICPEVENDIHFTLDGSIPSLKSQIYNQPLWLDSSSIVTAAAFDQQGNISIPVYTSFQKVKLRESVTPKNLKKGLSYKYFETESWRRLSVVYDFNSIGESGVVDNFDIAVRHRENGFGIRFSGYIKILTEGIYTFEIDAANGANLFIGQYLVVDNSGKHPEKIASGKVALEEGDHPITLTYFYEGKRRIDEVNHKMVLDVKFSGPGFKLQSIPDSLLFH